MFLRVYQVRAIVRLRAFDVNTEQGRSQERLRRVAITALSSALAKVVAIATTLISVPLTIGYLGEERYGLWMTISTVVTLLAFTDLGIGNGLLTAISEADGRNDRELARTYVSSTFYMLVGLAMCLGCFFAIIFPHISWGKVFNVTTPKAVAEAGPAIGAFVGCFLINMPLGVVNKIQLGYQEGFENNLWAAFGNLLGLLGVLLVIWFHGSLFWLVVAMAGAPIVVVLLNGARLFIWRRPWLWPNPCFTSYRAAKRVLGLGVLFFVLQFAAAVAYSSDNIILAHILGPSAVTQYSVHARLFSLISMIFMMVLTPLWPAYTEAIARGDVDWVHRTLSRSLWLSATISFGLSVILIVWGPTIMRLWVGEKVLPVLPLFIGLGVWTVLGTIGNALAMFLNGAKVMQFQVVAALVMACTAICLKITLTQRIGSSGVILGTVIAYTLAVVVPSVFIVPRELKKVLYKLSFKNNEDNFIEVN